MLDSFRLFPPEASTMAGKVDALFYFLIIVCGAVTLLVAILIIWFAIHYHAPKHRVTQPTPGGNLLESFWIFVPVVIFVVMFVWGARLYMREYGTPPPNAIVINVVGKQWMWKMQQPGGQREINELHIPADTPIHIRLISQDVIHSFFLPAFRVKMDALPNRYRNFWFEANRPGVYHLYCSEYCGTGHSRMRGEIIVMKPQEYADWVTAGRAEGSAASRGQKLFQDLACITCHRSDAAAHAPNLVGLYGQRVYLSDGTVVTADDNYIRESILYPQAKVVLGFAPIMPAFLGQINESQLLDLLAYIKSLSAQEPVGPLNNRTVPPAGPRPGEATTQQP